MSALIFLACLTVTFVGYSAFVHIKDKRAMSNSEFLAIIALALAIANLVAHLTKGIS